jgi:uncharacterized protein involved in exopolysaccharide biosynthesis/Mrp family chromosome partitioning ATPase
MTIVQIPALASQAGPPQRQLNTRKPGVEEVPTSRVFSILLRHKWLILVTLLCVTAPAAWIVYSIPPYFDAQAAIMINTRKAAFRDLQATVEANDADAVAIGTQVGILRSPSMALRVVDRLNLTQAPEFKQALLPHASILTRAVAMISGWVGAARPAERPLTPEQERQITGQMLAKMVTILNDGHSYLITISARTESAQLSAAIANAFADLYLDFNRQLKIAAIGRANSLLDDEIAPLRLHVKQAEDAVESFRQTNGLITGRGDAAITQPENGSTVSEAQLSQINSELIAASDELAQKQSNLNEIRAALRSGRLDSIPAVVESPLISALRAQQTLLGSKVASLSQTAGADNPELREATAASADITARINAEVGKIAASVASQAAAAQRRVATLHAALDRLQGTVATESRANVTLRQLESEAIAARNVYQDYLGRLQHTSSDAALQEPEADLISPALPPIGNSGPPRSQLTGLAVIIALGVGSGLALVVDRMRQGIRSVEQLEATTGLRGLGLIPSAPLSVRMEKMEGSSSVYSGAIGLVANVIRFGNDLVRAQVVLVTSSVPAEGKTTFSVSLAAHVGREGGRALLIDCDLHNPSVATELRLAQASSGPEQTTLTKDVLPGVDVLVFKRSAEPRVGGMADTLRLLLADARSRYDLIVLDTPPVLAFADAPILSMQVDGVIMVVRWRHTPVTAVSSALGALRAYGVRVVGGVVTRVKLSELDSAEGGYPYLYRTYERYFS